MSRCFTLFYARISVISRRSSTITFESDDENDSIMSEDESSFMDHEMSDYASDSDTETLADDTDVESTDSDSVLIHDTDLESSTANDKVSENLPCISMCLTDIPSKHTQINFCLKLVQSFAVHSMLLYVTSEGQMFHERIAKLVAECFYQLVFIPLLGCDYVYVNEED